MPMSARKLAEAPKRASANFPRNKESVNTSEAFAVVKMANNRVVLTTRAIIPTSNQINNPFPTPLRARAATTHQPTDAMVTRFATMRKNIASDATKRNRRGGTTLRTRQW